MQHTGHIDLLCAIKSGWPAALLVLSCLWKANTVFLDTVSCSFWREGCTQPLQIGLWNLEGTRALAQVLMVTVRLKSFQHFKYLNTLDDTLSIA